MILSHDANLRRMEFSETTPLMIGLLVFAVILTGTLAGRSVRRFLPRGDLTDETKSLVSVSMAVVTTISALVLGLLISNANTSFIALGGQVTSLSAQIIPLGQKIKAEKNGDTVLIRGSPVGRGDYDL